MIHYEVTDDQIFDIVKVPSDKYSSGYGFTFKVRAGDSILSCGHPTGDWAMILPDPKNPNYFKGTVDVGWGRLDRIYKKQATATTGRRKSIT